MYRTQAQRIWSAEARAKVLYFFNNFSFETEEYMKTLENSRNDNAECVMVVGWAI